MKISNKFRLKREYKFSLVLLGIVMVTFWFGITVLQFRGFVLTSLVMELASIILIYFGLFAPTFIDVVCPKCNYSVKEEYNYCPNCGIEFKEMRTLM